MDKVIAARDCKKAAAVVLPDHNGPATGSVVLVHVSDNRSQAMQAIAVKAWHAQGGFVGWGKVEPRKVL
jgi:hypothetical protein